MKNSKFLLILSASLLLASCGRLPQGETTSEAISDTSVASSEHSVEHTSEEEETYVIAVNVSSGLHLNVSKQRAKKGDIIEITVASLDQGYVLVALYANGSKLIADSSGVYSFTMPNRSVEITADVDIDGEVTIKGEISAKLEEETPNSGLFVARNVQVSSNSGFYFSAFGKRLTMVNMDHTKCLADIELAQSANYEMVLAGGSTYDFFYDSKADPEAGNCYIRRVRVDTLPSDPNTLLSIFDGHSRSESTENVEGLLSIDYVNRITDVKYEWQNFVDGSLGIATKASDNESSLGVNYRKLSDGVFASADTYLEYLEHRAPGTASKAESGKYGVVDRAENIQPGYGRYSVTAHDAEFLAHHSGHATESIRFDLMDSFYIGFDATPDIGTDGLGLFDRVITSEFEEGGFKVTIDSYREIDTTNTTSASEHETSYYKYDATLHFDEKGQFLSASYLGKRYSEAAYNFASHTLIDPNTFTKVADLQVTYTYGEAIANNNYDASLLFSSTLTGIVRDSHVSASLQESNAIAVAGDSAADTVNAHLTLASNLGEEEFLDVKNFTIIDYDDHDVLDTRTASDPFTLLPVAGGTVNITIGNPMVASAPRFTMELTVEDAVKVRSFYMVGENGVFSASQELLDGSDSFTMPAGKVRRFQVWGSPNDVKNVMFTPVSSRPDLLRVERYEVNHQAFILFDASNTTLDSSIDVYVTLQSDRYMDGYDPKVFTVHLTPGSAFDPHGTWYLIDSFDSSYHASSVDRNTVVNIQEFDPDDAANTASTVTVTKGNNTAVYSFGFNLDEETGVGSITKVRNGNVGEISITETVDGYLGIALVADDVIWGGQDVTSDPTEVLGQIVKDEEGNVEQVLYDSFDLASNWPL